MYDRSKIKYASNSKLSSIMLGLVVIFPIPFWLALSTIKDMILEKIFIFIVMWGFILLAYIFTSRSKRKFIANRDEIMSKSLKANGRILRVINEATRIIRENDDTNVPRFTSIQVEYYNQYISHDTVVLVEGLSKIPYGKERYTEESNKYGEIYTPKENLKCTVYYTEDGRVFIE